MNKHVMWILIALGILGGAFVAAVAYESYQASHMMVKKPAIYLYPEEDSFVNVKLDINGKITRDIPTYSDGWNVFVTKEGLIDYEYDYLFYEAKLNELELPSIGWVVKYQDLSGWLDINLIKLGLNEKEKAQFKEYWLKELPKANYYEIKLLTKEFLEKNMNVIISPQPDMMIRLNFYFKPLKEKTVLSEPEIILSPERKGFTAVEWGGALDN